jgi:glycosyltransferase involved in cell wall biosynthesis
MNKNSIILLGKEEKDLLLKVIEELVKTNSINEIIVVTDDPAIKIFFTKNDIQIKTIQQEEKGYGAAIKAGFKSVKNDFAFIFNGDGSFDPSSIKKMIESTKDSDFIFCSRYHDEAGSEDDTIVTLIGNKIFSFLGKVFFGLSINDILYTYVLCNVKKFNNLNLKNNDFRLCVELPILIKKNNFTYSMIPSRERSRKSGVKKVNAIKDGALILFEMIKQFIKK